MDNSFAACPPRHRGCAIERQGDCVRRLALGNEGRGERIHLSVRAAKNLGARHPETSLAHLPSSFPAHRPVEAVEPVALLRCTVLGGSV